MRIPSDSEIRALHERFAPTPQTLASVLTHCEIVCRIAEQLLATPSPNVGANLGPDLDPAPALDPALVRAGCLLHDIGVYALYDHEGTLDHANYIRHGILGHEMLRDAGLPEALCRFCSCHTGVGLTQDDITRQHLPLPPGDYQPQTPEEQLVMYADKFHSKKTPPTFLTAATYATTARRFGPGKEATFTALVTHYGEPDLTALSHEYGHAIQTTTP
ncbi:HD domain-containing protein [Winogradskya consettensis]|uniref:HD/PDEase domain-containing protein n=1 Tax=Winogradskya consettensis TaxID=113560 RepID=A0A919SKP5_9ACTN|nr:HD domain-containing protein [Actinoplanes consettensis]GIM72728.1 hypothetical protein Aco04nite_31650 [Actinoplanes consettensis]